MFRFVTGLFVKIVATTGLLLGVCLSAQAEESWFPSQYGSSDTLGAINNLSAEKVVAAARLIKHGKNLRPWRGDGPGVAGVPA